MTTSVGQQSRAVPAQLAPALLLVLALAAVAALALPGVLAEYGPLTSDESLYAQEGFNIAEGKGYTYTTGEPVHHRAPLFPALLAADYKLFGPTIKSGHLVTKLFALGGAALALAIGWRFFGQWTGVLAGGLSVVSALLTLIGSSLFLDGVQAFFLLMMLLLLHESLVRGSVGWAAGAGVAFGLAVLTKESALLWAPLPFLAVLLRGREVEHAGSFLAAFTIAALAVAGWWWPYVYAVTGQVYLLGDSSNAAMSFAAVEVLGLVLGVLVFLAVRRGQADGLAYRMRSSPAVRWLASMVIVVAWGALFLHAIEQHSGWPYPNDYLSNVPDYVGRVLRTWLYPLPLIAIAWCYIGYRAVRGSLGDQLLLLGLLLFLPFALFVANRQLHIRDMLPVVALSYIALARATVDGARAVAEALGRSVMPSMAGALVTLLLLCGFGWYVSQEAFRSASYQVGFDPYVVEQSHWDNPLAQDAAAWMRENLPEDARVMSERLYFAQLYMLTEGKHPWWQLPTVRVEFDDDRLVRASTLFRWEDETMPGGGGEPWLYLRQYPEQLYYIALSERDLMDGMRENNIDYLVVTGEDAAFSTLALMPYFLQHPAFTLEQSYVANSTNQVHILRVDRSKLEPLAPPALVSTSTIEALESQFGVRRTEALLSGLSPAGHVTSSGGQTAALEGADR